MNTQDQENDFEEQIKALRKLGMGWLKPDGSILACHTYRHIEAILENQEVSGELKLWLSSLKILEDQSQEDNYNWTADLGPDDHPSWHAYSSDAEDRIAVERGRIMSHLYQEGWVRLGTFKKQGQKFLEAEGCPAILVRKKRELEDIALFLDRHLVCTPLAQRTQTFSLKITHEEFQEGNPNIYKNLESDFIEKRKKSKHGLHEKLSQHELEFKWSANLDVVSLHDITKIPNFTWDLVPVPTRKYALWGNTHLSANPSQKKQLEQVPQSVIEHIRQNYLVKIPTREELTEVLQSVGANGFSLDGDSFKP